MIYRLKLSYTMQIYLIFPVSLLKKYNKNLEIIFLGRIQEKPTAVKIQGKLELEVEQILDKQKRGIDEKNISLNEKVT